MVNSISEEKLVEIMSGDSTKLEDFIKNNNLKDDDLKNLLKDEQAGQNRKKVKEFLKTEITKRNLSRAEENIDELYKLLKRIEDSETDQISTQSELKTLEDIEVVGLVEANQEEFIKFIEEENIGVKQAKKLLKAETKADNRKNVKKHLRTFIINRKKIKNVDKIKKQLEKIEHRFNTLEKVSDQRIENLSKDIEHEELSENSGSIKEESIQEDKEKSGENDKKASDIENYLLDHGFDREEIAQMSENEKTNRKQKIQKKLDILDKIGSESSDYDLREVTIEELKELLEEKDKRKKLIDELQAKGIESDKLRKTTTDDLKKLIETIELKNQKNYTKEKSVNKTEKDIEKEVEEDLEILRGAVTEIEEETEVEERTTMEKMEDIRDKIEELFEDTGRVNKEKISPEKIEGLLLKYEQIESNKEKAIKVAHVMKSYLENRLGIKREMTYKELSKSLEAVDKSEYIHTVRKFFEVMSNQQYHESIRINNLDEIIEASKETIEELEYGNR